MVFHYAAEPIEPEATATVRPGRALCGAGRAHRTENEQNVIDRQSAVTCKTCLRRMPHYEVTVDGRTRRFTTRVGAQKHADWHLGFTSRVSMRTVPAFHRRPVRPISQTTARKLLKTVQQLAWFIENVTDDTPDRNEQFFRAREMWRGAIAAAQKETTRVRP